jgi:hypothetical protein
LRPMTQNIRYRLTKNMPFLANSINLVDYVLYIGVFRRIMKPRSSLLNQYLQEGHA